MTLPGLLASCARQDGDILKILTLSYVSYPYLKSHAGWAPYFSHTENEIKKPEGGRVQRPLRVNLISNSILKGGVGCAKNP